MKKTLAIMAAGAFAAAVSTSALACGYGMTASAETPEPITTALKAQPMTPIPETQPATPKTKDKSDS